MHIGRKMIPGGRIAEPAVPHFTESITRHGIRSERMKTGTPVRIDKRSVHFEDLEIQEGEHDFHRFSYISEPRPLPQLTCWTCNTNPAVHETLRSGLKDSPLYNGQIQSIGPRYCPSIETKLVTFPDRPQHLLFLEPEGETTNEMYLNGFSSSLPMDVQIAALKKIPALRDLKVYRPGYAIEYDFFDPTQLKHSLESKVVKGLFFAGQVNGTTGYEEAGGQGTLAGINAARYCNNDEPFILHRDEAYIGVLIDDLVTKGVDEPYRMFTSRAEYRILLRQDDADARLTEKAYELGIAKRDRYEWWLEKKEAMEKIEEFCKTYPIKPKLINSALEAIGSTPLVYGCKLEDLVARPELNFNKLYQIVPDLKELIDKLPNRQEEIAEAAEIHIKYKGYIEREKDIAEKIARLEDLKIPEGFDFEKVSGLTIECRQKLKRYNPRTIAQASRISGVSPSDISVLLVYFGR
jgi:tRNA uridine 5-carboxymethylaminomethyl modification enzyme